METIVVLVVAAFYFAPAAVAYSRKHKSAGAILVLNMLLGWTLLGWILAAVWAHTGNVAATEPTPETHVKCPDCRELVLKDAKKCKHCGTALVPSSDHQP